jgi:hypothetical protein
MSKRNFKITSRASELLVVFKKMKRKCPPPFLRSRRQRLSTKPKANFLEKNHLNYHYMVLRVYYGVSCWKLEEGGDVEVGV